MVVKCFSNVDEEYSDSTNDDDDDDDDDLRNWYSYISSGWAHHKLQEKYPGVSGSICPTNFVPNQCVHFMVDNIDILDSGPYEKDTFHGAQAAGSC